MGWGGVLGRGAWGGEEGEELVVELMEEAVAKEEEQDLPTISTLHKELAPVLCYGGSEQGEGGAESPPVISEEAESPEVLG